jgi:nucleotide-binding universal stress UspA family protein/GNAT superfamily N-acetyltransferase
VRPRPITLSDGARVVVRPIAPDDREALRAGFERLSPESRYRRFFTSVQQLTDRDLDYLTRIDHHDHEALVGVDAEHDQIVGVARYVRTGPDEAEPAVVVADDWQRRGLGGRLLEELSDRAREEGVRRFRGPVLAGNEAALAVLGGLGEVETRPDGIEVEVAVLLAEPETARARLVALLRAAAQGVLEPGITLVQQLAPRRTFGPPDREQLANAIVVGVDPQGSPTVTLDAAAELARALGARLDLVAARGPLLDDDEEAGRCLDSSAERLRASGLDVRIHVPRREPATALIDVATEQRAALVVVGPSRRTDVARLLPGDVTDTVARHAPCDVLIVRERADVAATPGG